MYHFHGWNDLKCIKLQASKRQVKSCLILGIWIDDASWRSTCALVTICFFQRSIGTRFAWVVGKEGWVLQATLVPKYGFCSLHQTMPLNTESCPKLRENWHQVWQQPESKSGYKTRKASNIDLLRRIRIYFGFLDLWRLLFIYRCGYHATWNLS